MAPVSLEIAINKTPRMRDWRFSSVSPVVPAGRAMANVSLRATCAASMGSVSITMPSRDARS